MLRHLSATFALAACLSLPAAATIKIAVPTLSGHFDEEMQGRSAAALHAIYEECGERVQFVQFRWGQHWLAYEDDESFDAVALVWDDAGVPGYPSNAYIHSRNGVAFRADAGFDIQTLQDLKGLRVLGFGGATNMFPALEKILPLLGSYWEAPPGFATTQALVAGDADAFVTDGLIFAIDYMERVKQTGGAYGDSHWPRMKFTALFEENGDKMHFRSMKKRNEFNTCLARARNSGAITKATEAFVIRYRDIVGDQVPDH
jgi:ABC-type amino acid transport substrate-binding protein